MRIISFFLTRQFAQFVAVGGVAAILHWLARFALSRWLPFSWAVALAYAVGMAVAFVLNAIYVFPASVKPRSRQVRDFLLINLAFFPVVWMVSVVLNEILIRFGITDHSEGVAHALAIPVPMLATFLLYKFFAFKEGRNGRQ